MVTWAVLPSGRKMPVDATPSERGNVELKTALDGTVRAEVIGTLAPRAGRVLHMSHFATCPFATSHRKASR